MRRRNPDTGQTREVTHYYTIQPDVDPDAQFAPKETFSFSVYEHDAEAYHIVYHRNGEQRIKGVPHCIFHRGGYWSAASAEIAAQSWCGLGGVEASNVKAGNREPKPIATERK